jgi:parallel beta-helix repeat protein
MNKRIAVILLSLATVFGFVILIIEIAPIVESSKIIYVDDVPGQGPGNPPENYTNIQDAINAASDGDTVYVYSGRYYEHVVVNKTINLTGENKDTTIIDIDVGISAINVVSNWVNVSGFTVIGNGPSSGDRGIDLDLVFNCNINNNIALMNSFGIHIFYSYNNNITGNNLSNNGYGIRLSGSGNNIMYNNASHNDRAGIDISSFSDWNNLIGNNVTNNEDGIWLSNSDNNSLINNIITSNSERGIFIHDSLNNFLTGNIMINNGILFNDNSQLNHWNTHYIDTSNTVNGKPVYYWKNQVGGTIPAGAGQVILANCTNVKIEGQELTKGTVGIQLGFSSYNDIIGNNASSNNLRGIQLYNSSNNNIFHNYVSSNSRFCGIWLRQSNGNNITGNFALLNLVGISFSYSDYNLIADNTVFLNDYWGIYLRSSSMNDIIGNTVSSNGEYGIYLKSESLNSSNNNIYHNNIIDNAFQAIDDTNNGNQWDNGYPSGGNYWSDYDGVDLNSTPSQDVPPPDGIGDTPYIIDSDSQDNYPLMEPIFNRTFLYEGWNLISIPFIQPDTNLGIVLNSIKGSYDAVQWYNVSDNSDPWKHNSIKKPSHLNDLDDIHHTMGFWIHITQPGGILFQYSGIQPTVNQTITLHPGWNLVGYPSLTNYNTTQGLNNITFGADIDSIWTYNAATKKWEEIGPSDYFEIGRGYWIHSKVKKDWEIPLK